MTGFNRVVLAGHLTRDPQLRQIPSGDSVADLGLATSERYKNRSGEQVEKTCFVDIVAWGRQAETCGQYLTKGSPVLVEGRLQLDRWENKDGQPRSKIRVKADRIQFLNRGPESEAPPAKEPEEGAEAGVEEGDNLPF
jgi:single-strand DNA-binding protein